MPFRSASLPGNIRRLQGFNREVNDAPPITTTEGSTRQDAKESAIAWSAKAARNSGAMPWLDDVPRLQTWNERFAGSQMGFEFRPPPPPDAPAPSPEASS